jgi:hypothetical protein
MDTIDLSQEIERELVITSTTGSLIRLQLLNLNGGELAVYQSFCVRILEVPSGLGYAEGRVAAFAVANREGKEMDDLKSTTAILLFSTVEVAPGYFGLLTQGAVDRAFKIEKIELR